MNANNTNQDDHAKAWELLPWLANGTLDEWSKSSVERHTSECVTCRREFELLRGVAVGTRSVDDRPLQPERSLATMMERIDQAEKGRGTGVVARVAEWIDRARIAPRALLATQVVAVLLVVVAVGWFWSTGQAPRFQTLSNASEDAGSQEPRLRVVFDDRLSVAEMREILGGINGDVVDGPSPHGVYTVELASLSGNPVDLSAAIDKLRQSDGVRFAEPLGEGATGLEP